MQTKPIATEMKMEDRGMKGDLGQFPELKHDWGKHVKP